jgi:hypothetical protein
LACEQKPAAKAKTRAYTKQAIVQLFEFFFVWLAYTLLGVNWLYYLDAQGIDILTLLLLSI